MALHVKVDSLRQWRYNVAPMARPPKKPERKHSKEIRCRVQPNIDKLIRKAANHAAKRKGFGNLSDWMREALIDAAHGELGEND